MSLWSMLEFSSFLLSCTCYLNLFCQRFHSFWFPLTCSTFARLLPDVGLTRECYYNIVEKRLGYDQFSGQHIRYPWSTVNYSVEKRGYNYHLLKLRNAARTIQLNVPSRHINIETSTRSWFHYSINHIEPPHLNFLFTTDVPDSIIFNVLIPKNHLFSDIISEFPYIFLSSAWNPWTRALRYPSFHYNRRAGICQSTMPPSG